MRLWLFLLSYCRIDVINMFGMTLRGRRVGLKKEILKCNKQESVQLLVQASSESDKLRRQTALTISSTSASTADKSR